MTSILTDPAGIVSGWLTPPDAEERYCLTQQQLEESCARALSTPVLALDTETLGLNPWEHKGRGIFGLSFAWREGEHVIGRYVPLRHKNDRNLGLSSEVLRCLKALLYEQGPLRVGHNFRFDAMFFVADELWGALPAAPVECTRVLAWIENEERGGGGYSLKSLTAELLPIGERKLSVGAALAKRDGKASDWSELSVDEIGPYAAQDARSTLLLWEALSASIRKQDEEAAAAGHGHASLSNVRALERDVTPVIWGMEARGIAIDLEYARKASDLALVGKEACERGIAKLLEAAGYSELLPLQMTKKDWLGTAAQALGYQPKEWVASGEQRVPATSAAAFYRADFGEHPYVRYLLAWRAYEGAIKKYFKPLLERSARGPDGTWAVHTEISQCSARSGRLQASNPNLMNLPLFKIGSSRQHMMLAMRAGGEEHEDTFEQAHEMEVANELEVRRCFVPREDCVFVFADYGQQELRAFADIAQVQQYLEAFREGRDVHAMTASLVAPDPGLEPEQHERRVSWRSLGKLCNFGQIFGMQADRFYTTAGYDQRVAEETRQYKSQLPKASAPEVKAFFESRVAFYMNEAAKICRAYHRGLPRVAQFHEILRKVGYKRGYIANKYGRRRRKPAFGKFPPTRWFNFIVQGSCADLLRDTLVNVAEECRVRQLDCHPILTVHDELIYEVWRPHVAAVKEVLLRCMTKPANWGVEFPVDLKVSDKMEK